MTKVKILAEGKGTSFKDFLGEFKIVAEADDPSNVSVLLEARVPLSNVNQRFYDVDASGKPAAIFEKPAKLISVHGVMGLKKGVAKSFNVSALHKIDLKNERPGKENTVVSVALVEARRLGLDK